MFLTRKTPAHARAAYRSPGEAAAAAEVAAAAEAVAAAEAASSEAAEVAAAAAACRGELAAGARSEHAPGYVERTQVDMAGLTGSIQSLSCLQCCPFGEMGSIAHDECQREILA